MLAYAKDQSRKGDPSYMIAYNTEFDFVEARILAEFRSQCVVAEWMNIPHYDQQPGDDPKAIDSYNKDHRTMVHLFDVQFQGGVVASVGIGSEHAMMIAAGLCADEFQLPPTHVFQYNGHRNCDFGRAPSGAGNRGRDRGRSDSGRGNGRRSEPCSDWNLEFGKRKIAYKRQSANRFLRLDAHRNWLEWSKREFYLELRRICDVILDTKDCDILITCKQGMYRSALMACGLIAAFMEGSADYLERMRCVCFQDSGQLRIPNTEDLCDKHYALDWVRSYIEDYAQGRGLMLSRRPIMNVTEAGLLLKKIKIGGPGVFHMPPAARKKRSHAKIHEQTGQHESRAAHSNLAIDVSSDEGSADDGNATRRSRSSYASLSPDIFDRRTSPEPAPPATGNLEKTKDEHTPSGAAADPASLGLKTVPRHSRTSATPEGNHGTATAVETPPFVRRPPSTKTQAAKSGYYGKYIGEAGNPFPFLCDEDALAQEAVQSFHSKLETHKFGNRPSTADPTLDGVLMGYVDRIQIAMKNQDLKDFDKVVWQASQELKAHQWCMQYPFLQNRGYPAGGTILHLVAFHPWQCTLSKYKATSWRNFDHDIGWCVHTVRRCYATIIELAWSVIETKNDNGRTPLLQAIAAKNLLFFQALINADAGYS
jgi:hypothetical protein